MIIQWGNFWDNTFYMVIHTHIAQGPRVQVQVLQYSAWRNPFELKILKPNTSFKLSSVAALVKLENWNKVSELKCFEGICNKLFNLMRAAWFSRLTFIIPRSNFVFLHSWGWKWERSNPPIGNWTLTALFLIPGWAECNLREVFKKCVIIFSFGQSRPWTSPPVFLYPVNKCFSTRFMSARCSFILLAFNVRVLRSSVYSLNS